MGYNNDLPWQSAMLVEQALIEAKVPLRTLDPPSELLLPMVLKELTGITLTSL